MLSINLNSAQVNNLKAEFPKIAKVSNHITLLQDDNDRFHDDMPIQRHHVLGLYLNNGDRIAISIQPKKDSNLQPIPNTQAYYAQGSVKGIHGMTFCSDNCSTIPQVIKRSLKYLKA